jgi:chromate reductase
MRVLGISGSLRADSHNTRLLRRAAEHLPAGVELELFEGLGEIPPYTEDADVHGEKAVEALREAIADADAVLFATPEYNGSIPGQLKNALDWVSRPRAESALQNKPVAVISASTGQFGGVWAQNELRKVASTMGARAVETDFALSKADTAWHPSGALAEPSDDEKLAEALGALVAEVERSLLLVAA